MLAGGSEGLVVNVRDATTSLRAAFMAVETRGGVAMQQNMGFGRVRVAGSGRPFTVLALESSADDTCAAVVTSSRRILSNVVVKQLRLSVRPLPPSHHVLTPALSHEPLGGIHPTVAIDAHQRNMVRSSVFPSVVFPHVVLSPPPFADRWTRRGWRWVT